MESEAAGLRPNATLLEVIAAAGGMDLRNPQVLGQAQAILELPRRVTRELDFVDDERAVTARRGLRVLAEALNLSHLQRPWREISTDIGEAGRTALATASLLLDQTSTERAVDEEALNRLADEIRSILEDVRMNSSIPEDLRQYTETSLVAILHSIDDYWLKGSVVLEGAIDSAIGRAYRQPKSDKASSTWKRIGKVLVQVAAVVAFANDAASLPESISDVVQTISGTYSSVPAISEAPESGPSSIGA